MSTYKCARCVRCAPVCAPVDILIRRFVEQESSDSHSEENNAALPVSGFRRFTARYRSDNLRDNAWGGPGTVSLIYWYNTGIAPNTALF